MSNKCVVFSFNYPPRIGGESLVTYKLLKNSEISFDVISSTYTKGLNSDLKSRDGIRVYNSTASATWPFFAVRQFRKLKTDYDCMMSRSMPVISHIPALIVKFLHPKMKWIASISDPIYNTPYRKSKSFKARFLVKIEDSIEKKVYKKADRLIFTNKYMMQYILQGKYEKYRLKAEIIGFGYDSSVVPRKNGEIDELIMQAHEMRHAKIIAHVGAMYGDRNADIFVEGYKRYIAEIKKDEPPIEVLFLGASKKNLMEEIEKTQLAKYFHTISTVPYEESLYCMGRVDGLFLIDVEFEHINPSIFLPSKVYDYVYARKPIAVFGREEGPVPDLLAGTGYSRFEYTIEGVKKCLLQFSGSVPEPVYQDITEYSVSVSSKTLDRIIRELTVN